jgi:FkbM family methyltransferase
MMAEFQNCCTIPEYDSIHILILIVSYFLSFNTREMISITRPVRKIAKKIRNRLTGDSIINYRGLGKINVIDVGSLGNLPEPWLSNSRYIKNLLSFEPLENAGRKKNVIISASALWSEKCKKQFYIYKGFRSSGSSLFEQNFEYVGKNYEKLKNIGPRHLAETWRKRSQLVKAVEIECETLDSVIDDLNVPFSFDFLKIDAQGAEYEILLGAKDFLRDSCIGLHLELFNIPLYKGIKLLPDVVELLNLHEFELAKKMPLHGSFNSQNDCLFLRKDVPSEKKEIYDLIRTIYRL